MLAIVAALSVKLYMSTVPPPLFLRVPSLEIAHRGYSFGAPENTVAAFKVALEQRVIAVEVDLMLSKDGVVVVAHDYKLDNFTDSTGLISEKTWSELCAVTVTRGGKSVLKTIRTGVDDKLARFEDIVKAARDAEIQLVIELKTVTNSSHMIKRSAEILKEYNYVGNTLITSFVPTMLVEFHRHCPEAYTLLLYSHRAFRTFCAHAPDSVRSSTLFHIACYKPEIFDNIASYLVEPIAKIVGAGAVGLDVQNPHISSLATRAIGWGLKVVLWTVNSIPQRELVAAIHGNERGAIAIMSDCPHSFCPAE